MRRAQRLKRFHQDQSTHAIAVSNRETAGMNFYTFNSARIDSTENALKIIQQVLHEFQLETNENKVGINIEFQDLDEKAKGDPDFFHFRHVSYLSKVAGLNKSHFKSFSTLLITPDSMNIGNKK